MGRQVTPERLWSKDFVLAMGVSFFVGMVFYMLMTTLALYAVEQFAASESQAGLAASMFIVGSTASRLFAGTLVDVVGRRRILVICLAVFVAASGGYFLADSLPALLALRFGHGTAFGLATTAVIAVGQSLIPPMRRGEGTSYFALSMTVATAVGPVLALTLVDREGYPGLFGGIATMSVLALAIGLVLRGPAAPPHPHPVRRFHLSRLVDPAVLPVAGFVLVLGVAFSGVLTFLNSFAHDRGLPGGAATFFLSYAIVLAVSRFVMGRLQDIRGDNVVIYPSILAFAIGLGLLATAQSTAMLVVAGAFAGLGYGTLLAAAQAIVVAAVPPHRLGVGVSTLYLCLDLGSGLGPIALGWLVAGVGYGPMYGVLGVLVVASAVMYHLVHGRTGHARRHLA